MLGRERAAVRAEGDQNLSALLADADGDKAQKADACALIVGFDLKSGQQLCNGADDLARTFILEGAVVDPGDLARGCLPHAGDDLSPRKAEGIRHLTAVVQGIVHAEDRRDAAVSAEQFDNGALLVGKLLFIGDIQLTPAALLVRGTAERFCA